MVKCYRRNDLNDAVLLEVDCEAWTH